MEDAKITQSQPKQEPLYQQGRYPSIVDTDDLVFEMGKQVVNHLNHEKLIDRIVKQTEAIQQENLQLKSIKIETEQKVAPLEQRAKQLEESNKLYEVNNRKLDAEIVSLRNKISTTTIEYRGKEDAYNKNIESLKAEIIKLREDTQTIVSGFRNEKEMFNKDINSLKAQIKELEAKETELNKRYEECSNTLKKRKSKADKKNQITTVQ